MGILETGYSFGIEKAASDKDRRRRMASGAVIGAGAGTVAPVAVMYAQKRLGVPLWGKTIPAGIVAGLLLGAGYHEFKNLVNR